jgi:DNA repair protein RadC
MQFFNFQRVKPNPVSLREIQEIFERALTAPKAFNEYCQAHENEKDFHTTPEYKKLELEMTQASQALDKIGFTDFLKDQLGDYFTQKKQLNLPFDLISQQSEYLLRLKYEQNVNVKDLTIRSVADVAAIHKDLAFSDREKVYVVSLDKNDKVLGTELVAIGTTIDCVFDAKNILKVPLLLNAKSIVIFHNHPGGTPSPSQPDIQSTSIVKKVAADVGITLKWHIIIAGKKYVTFTDANDTVVNDFIPLSEPSKNNIPQYSVEYFSPNSFPALLNSPTKAVSFAKKVLEGKDNTLGVFYMDSQNKVASVMFYPQDIYSNQEELRKCIIRDAILNNAVATITARNYVPSKQEAITVKDALSSISVFMHDNIIYDSGKYYSAREYGLMENSVGSRGMSSWCLADPLAQYDLFKEISIEQKKTINGDTKDLSKTIRDALGGDENIKLLSFAYYSEEKYYIDNYKRIVFSQGASPNRFNVSFEQMPPPPELSSDNESYSPKRDFSSISTIKNISIENIPFVTTNLVEQITGKRLDSAVKNTIQNQPIQQNDYQQAGGRKNAEGRGILDEYYTPQAVSDGIWQLVGKYKDLSDPQNILEPSAGVGNFFINKEFNPETTITAIELSPNACKTLRQNLDNVNAVTKIENIKFESLFRHHDGRKKDYDVKHDIVIGNPPYGTHRGFYKGLGEEPQIKSYQEYFLKRGADVLAADGIMAMVIPSGFLRGEETKAKQEICKTADLLEAYRLPNNIFKGTDVGTDIVLFRKDRQAVSDEIVKARINTLSNDFYFENHQENIIGTQTIRKDRYGKDVSFIEGNINDISSFEFPSDIVPLAAEQATEQAPKQDLPSQTTTDPVKTQNKSPQQTKSSSRQKSSVNNAVYIVNEKVAQTRPLRSNTNISERELILWKNTGVDGSINPDFQDRAKQNFADLIYFHNDKWYNEFNYLQGNIYEKLESLELNKGALLSKISASQYEKQKMILESVLPKTVPLEKIKLSALDNITNEILIDGISLRDRFVSHISNDLDHEMMGISLYDVEGYLNGMIVNRGDKEMNAKFRVKRREESERIFTNFIAKYLTTEQQNQIVKEYNVTRNAVHTPDYSKVPLFSEIFATFKDTDLSLRDCQETGVGFATNKGVGCFAHEVGAGKTITSILTNWEYMQRGWKSKPLIVVPASVYEKWIYEIKEICPNVKINCLSNMPKEVINELKEHGIPDKSISVVTINGFKKISFKQSTYEDLSRDLKDVITKNPTSQMEIEKEIAKAELMVGRAARDTSEVYFEDLGFDSLTLDEAHRYKNIFVGAQVKKDRRFANEYSAISGGVSSAQGVKAYFATQYILKNHNGKGVTLATATPFTNRPLEYYSMLSLMSRSRLQNLGLENVNDFMTAFMDLKSTFQVNSENKLVRKDEVERFKNAGQLRNLISEFVDYKDGDELGLIRPQKIQKTFPLNATQKQIDYIEKAQSLFNDKKAGAIVAITELQNITLSPYLSRYTDSFPSSPKEFIKDSPKIDFVMEAIRKNKETQPTANQIIYMPRGVTHHSYIQEYLITEIGYKKEEVVVMPTGEGDKINEKRSQIRDDFNSGKIKVLIGGETIKEGIDLQTKTTDIYVLHLQWNPNDIEQVAGRAWRFGNEWNKVRINFPLIENSVDPFIFQKLEVKAKRIKDARETNPDEEDVGNLDFEALKLDLITNPILKAEAKKDVLSQHYDSQIRSISLEVAELDFKFRKVRTLKQHLEYASPGDYQKSLLKKLKTAEKKLEGVDTEKVKQKISELNKQIEALENEKSTAMVAIDKEIEYLQKTVIQTPFAITNDYTKALSDIVDENKTFTKLDYSKAASVKPLDKTNNIEKSSPPTIVLPPLKGTPKQVNWAVSIRKNAIEQFKQENKTNELQTNLNNASAAWWINNRTKFIFTTKQSVDKKTSNISLNKTLQQEAPVLVKEKVSGMGD